MGGATISFINMIDGLIEYGVKPVVIIPRKGIHDERLIQYFRMKNIPYYQATIAPMSLPKPSGCGEFIKVCISFLLMIIRRIMSYYEIRRIAINENPDIIHTNVGIIREGYKVARNLRIKHILHIREYQDKDFKWLFIPSKQNYEKFVRKSDYIITITNDLRDYFHLNDISHAKTIYNGIYSRHDTIHIKDKKKYFLCASRIVPGKGYEDIIEAFLLFNQRHPDYELWIAGQGESHYISHLRKMIDRTTHMDKIKFLGHLDNVRPQMSEAKALLVASHSEGFGRMTAEAAFNGCIVIGRNTAGTKEILEKTGGFLFNDVESMVKRMEEVCCLSNEEYLKLSSYAQEKAIQLYSTENNTEQIYQLYTTLNQKENDRR